MSEKNVLSGRSLVGDSVSRVRVDNDYYATPEKSTEAILNEIKFEEDDLILEPACGEGHISKVIKKYYPNNKIFSYDLVDRGFGIKKDFFSFKDCKNFDVVITNPPFKLAQEFIEKGLKVSKKYVIMFAKIQLLEGGGRYKFFKKFPPRYIYVFVDRQNPLRNGNPFDENGKKWCSTFCFAWFVWGIGFKGEPTIKWLNTKLKVGGV